MDWSTIISFIPKLAATALVILGGLIAYELYGLYQSKKQADELDNKKNTDYVVSRFPQSLVKIIRLKKAKIIRVGYQSPRNKLFLIIGIPTLLIFMLVFVTGATFILNKMTNNTQPEPASQNQPTQQAANPVLHIYQYLEDGTIISIHEEDLTLLTPGTKIMISVSTTRTAQNVLFQVNDEAYEPPLDQKNDNGEIYIDYELKPGVVNYHVEVTVQ